MEIVVCFFLSLTQLVFLDWDDSETNLAQLTGSNGGNGDQLWEDNWDDDDIEDEFSIQLR